MKNYIKILMVSFGLFSLMSCDKEENPMYPQGLSDNELINLYFPGDPTLYEDSITFSDNTNSDRNVLIEDFTGHLCNNCPPAAVIAKGIEDANPGRAFVLSVHAGGANNTFQTVTGKFDVDYTTDAGTSASVDISGFVGNPSGMVSRSIPASASSPWTFKDDWNNQVNDLITTNDLKANIQLQAEFYPETKGVFVHYEIEALQDLGTNTRVIIFLAEKKTISPQKMEDNSTNETYEHHNVLSGNLTNGDFGDIINSNGMLTGEKTSGLVINSLNELNDRRVINEDGGNDLIIFGLIVDGDTYEVLQVVEAAVEIDTQL